ncbi:MAG: hypothetical protein HOM03_09815 [Marinovum sp.]|nr:hypothetical protein [Marinovum sp.]MBT6533253.1 hypothetical protein [Marinovum sp.]MBT7908522.1 hypothetical protein [Marinovum sp.]
MTSNVNIQQLFRQSFVEPKAAAKNFLALDLSYDAVFSLFLATVCASTVLIFGFDALFQNAQARPGLLESPWQFAAIVTVLTLSTAVGIAWIGQKLSGQGTLRTVMGLIAWLQVVQLGMQMVSYFTLILPSILVTFVQFGLIGWSFWIFIAFIDEVHKFENMMKSTMVAFLGTIIGMLGLFFMLGFFGLFGGGINGF